MVQAVAAEKLTLYALEQKFGLQEAVEADFFSEWQNSLPVLQESEKERLERVRAIYRNFLKRSAIESTISLIVISPLLDAAGLFLPPFYVETEKSVEIVAQDDSVIIRGRLDVVVVRDSFWVLTVESKRAEFSPVVGLPQVLSYMLAAPTPQKQLYGMVTNGRNFIFVKLDRASSEPTYSLSKEFVLNQDDDLEQTLRIIKRLAAIIPV